MDAPRAVLGRVTSVAPGKREARAKITPGLELDTAALAWAWFGAAGVSNRYKVAKAWAGDGELRLQFAPGVPMDTVRGLQGLEVAVAADVVMSRGPLWRRVREMVDLPAETRAGEHVGTVVTAFLGPKTGAIKVESEDGTAWLVPVIDGAVIAFDEERGVVVLGEFAQFADADGAEDAVEDNDAN